MVGHTPKRRRRKYPVVDCDENTHVTRSLLRKLVRAKQVPDIYKEVVRSQRRKSKLFRAPDTPSRCSTKGSVEKSEEELNEDSHGSEEILPTSDNRSRSLDNLNNDSSEDIGEEDWDKFVHKTFSSTREEFGTQCYTSTTVTTSSDSELERQSDGHTGLEDIAENMSQKTNKSRKSVSSESCVASPGVITRSQLKQLANAKSVPEEYKNVLGGTQPNRRNQKPVKSLNFQKLPSPRRLSAATRGRRVSKKVNQKENVQSSSEQNNSLDAEESFDVEMNNDGDLSVEQHGTNTPKAGGSAGEKAKAKNKRRKEDKVHESAVKTVCDSSSGEQSTGKMEFSEGENVATKESVTVLPQDKSPVKKETNKEAKADSVEMKTDNMETDNENEEGSWESSVTKAVLNSDVYDKKSATGKKIGRKRKGFSKISSASEQEISERIHRKERGNTTLERKTSICEPVDMSISEDCSGSEKTRYIAKSAPSDSEVSESFTKNHKNLAKDVSCIKGKRDKLSVNQGAQKSSEISSVTSSSYNSGYEVTPSKSLTVCKELSLSTKTTDSGITGMVDSNPYCDSDSCTSDKQQTLDNTQNLVSYPNNVTKEERHNVPRKSPVVDSSRSIVKTNSLLLNEGIPSCSGGKMSEIRQPFLLRMRQTNEEPVDSDSDAESRKAIMLSAQRRIEQNLSTTDSEGRRFSSHQTPTSSLLDAEDSDDAPPESMTFEAGRNTATESLRDAVESIRRDRQRRKEKRRARLEKLRQQKEEKLIRLKERLASQEDASCSSSEESGYEDEEVRHYKKKPPSREKTKTEKEISERTTKSKKKSSNIEGRVAKTKEMDNDTQEDLHIGISNGLTKRLPDELLERLSEKAPTSMKGTHFEKAEENAVNNSVISTQKKRKKAVLPSSEQSDEPSDSQSFKKPTNLDYIPLKSTTSTKFGIMSYDKVVNVSKSAAQKAAEFRQNMMFGNRHKREPANSGLIYQQKIKASGKDVFERKKY